MRKLILFLACYALMANVLIAQNDNGDAPTQNDADQIERAMEQSGSEGGEVANNTAFEDLEALLQKKTNLNTCTAQDLIILQEQLLITPLQAAALVAYRAKFGQFLAMQELQAVPMWDLETIRRVIPFVVVNGAIDDYQVSLKQLVTSGKNELFLRTTKIMERSKGYETPADPKSQRYLGDPYRHFIRFKHTYETKVSYGFTAEKDAGEEFFTGSQKQGFDFYSAHLAFKNINKTLKMLCIGDYEVRLGQGLTYWTGLSYGKGADVMNMKRAFRPIKEFSSANEAVYLRGAAATLGLNKNMTLTVFGSYRKRDGNLITPDTTLTVLNDEGASALATTGLHRTQAELDDRGSVTIATGGGNVTYRNNGLHVGVNVVSQNLDKPINFAVKPYNQFDFRGKNLLNGSVDYSYIYQNFNFYGETALSSGLETGTPVGLATINGLMVSVDRKISLSFVQRHYAKDYWNMNARAFGETQGVQNEDGLYMGVQVRPRREWLVNAYFDTYKHPWLRFGTDAPSGGYDGLIQINHRPARGTDIAFRYRYESKQQNLPANDTKLNQLIDNIRSSYRVQVSHKVSKAIELRTRIDYTTFFNGNTTSQGYLVYQDVVLKPQNLPLQLTGRFAIFNTDTYDTRIYAYENSVLYSFSVPSYYYQGTRFYVNLRYRPLKALTLEAHLGQSYIANRTNIGSGLDLIPTNTRTDAQVQMRISF